MISSTDAVDTLITQCQGQYDPQAYNTIIRTFEPSYTNQVPGFRNDELFNKVLSTYVSHGGINK